MTPDERKATVTYATTNSTLTYPFAFDYLRKEFIKVKYTDPEKVNVKLDYNTDYNVTESHITLHQSPPVGSMLTIYRETPTSKIVSWNDGSILRASDMSVQDVQVLHILEENEDILMFNALHYNEEIHTWDGKDRCLSNLADPTAAQDAVTKAYLEAEEGSFKALAESLVAQAEHQAILAGQQATISTTQATKSEEKANIATEQAEIATQKASTAMGAARAAIDASHSAESAANRAHEAKQEATLKAQTATEQAAIATTAATQITDTLEKVTVQADRAEAGVNTTIEHAEIATEQANRAEKEADRAKLMADISDTTEHNTGTTSHAAGIAGNAITATKLQTPRTISLNGDVTGSGSFDGSVDLQIETMVRALNLLQRNTTYAIGEIVYSRLLPSHLLLENAVEGLTSTEDLYVPKDSRIGDVIRDGSCIWVVRSLYHPPVGSIIDWENAKEPGDGFLKCNGATYHSEDYPLLAAIRAPNNQDTFAVPDRRGVVPRGLDENRGLDVDGMSRKVGEYQEDIYGEHTHVTWLLQNWNGGGGTQVGTAVSKYDGRGYFSPGYTRADVSGGNETRMKNVTTKYYICYA